MLNSIVELLLMCIFLLIAVNGQCYKEKYRLQLHYSVPNGWMNDPNGLIYLNGWYHLFYQHNPVNTTFGPVHWGHARSKNLIHWENLPIALKPYELGEIFSGCTIFDKNNVTGLLAPASVNKSIQTDVPLIAIYSINKNNAQNQGLAYSFDNGITWTQYIGNPILRNHGIPDFRDPNIFERNGKYYMTLAVVDRIEFYSSNNLILWERLGDFGIEPIEGDKTGVWECPSIVTLRDEQNNKHDILIVSENGPQNGSLLQYFVGEFNGTRFNSYDTKRVLWAENSFDQYATIPYHNDPRGRVVVIGWMSNWLYANLIPTSNWRGQMAIPREIGLKTIDGKLYLKQWPVDELNDIVDASRKWSLSEPLQIDCDKTIDFTSQIPFKTNSMLKLDYEFDIDGIAKGKCCLQFGNNRGEFVSFVFNISENMYELDRRHSGDVTFSPRFANTVSRAKRISKSKSLFGCIVLDVGSIEVFTDGGLHSFTALFFPTEPFENIRLKCILEDDGKSVTLNKLTVKALKSIW